MVFKLSLAKRIALGFSIVLIILGAIALIGYSKIKYIAELSHHVQENIEEDAFLTQKEVDHLKWSRSLSASMLGHTAIDVQIDPRKCSFGKWLYARIDDPELDTKYPPDIVKVFRALEPVHRKLHTSALHIKEHHSTFDLSVYDVLKERWIDHLMWLKGLQISLLTGEPFKGGLDADHCQFGKWHNSVRIEDEKLHAILDKMRAPHIELHQSAKKIVTLLSASKKREANEIFHHVTLKNIDTLSNHFNEAFKYLESIEERMSVAREAYDKETSVALDQTMDLLKSLREEYKEHMLDKAGDDAKDLARTAFYAESFVLIAGFIAIIIGVILAVVITRSISVPIQKACREIGDSSMQVTSASEQLSGASQELSSLSSEQAASIEETSASIEEITGMVQNNVDSATKCAELSEEVFQSSSQGNIEMEELIQSMKTILMSNENIQQLVQVIGEIGEKTAIIDEIVFQTKLLSFNASVEAERAGEHGRGFAVVAQEVGNLAQMSGKAAEEISRIVNDSVKAAKDIAKENRESVEAGNTVLVKTADALKAITVQSNSLKENVNNILVASKEQANGIQQVNTAIGELDKATQQNASTAEETASAGEELNAQAASLSSIIGELMSVITGEKSCTGNFDLLVTQTPQREVAGIDKKEIDKSDMKNWEEL